MTLFNVSLLFVQGGGVGERLQYTVLRLNHFVH